MAQRTALLNGNNVNRDTDFSKYIETVSEAGVIEGLEVSASSVAIGKAWIPCERSNGDSIFALFYNTAAVNISGNGDVYIEVSQTYIDNGELASEDGTGIAEIKVGTMPAKNALKLATISSGVVTDERNMIPKVGELSTQIESIFSSLADLDERVEALEEADAIDHLEESGLVGELYALTDKLFKQSTPILTNSTIDCNVGDTNDNYKVHIQRIGTGTPTNQLKLKVKSVGSPTTGLVVEVRKGVQVTVTANEEAYWYGSQLVCSGSIAYSSISNSYAEFTVNMDGNFGGTKGELLDVVIYQTGNIVNSTNYYAIACDSTQYSEGFSYVSENNNSEYTRSKLMPYCIANGFAQSLLCKVDGDAFEAPVAVNDISGGFYYGTSKDLFTATKTFDYHITGTYIWPRNTSTGCSLGGGTLVSGVSSVGKGGNIDCIYHVEAGSTVTVSSSGNGNNQEFKDFAASMVFYKPQDLLSLLPRSVRELGNLATGTLYGKHTDGVYYGGIITGTDTTATTGEITLGNAVGYVNVNFNGQIIKIPYYT